MATTETWDVDPGGAGDYTTLQAAETAKQADIVSADKVMVFECRSSDGSADTSNTGVSFGGWTTDATRYIEVVGTESHGGKWNSSNYRFYPATWHQGAVLDLAYSGGADDIRLRNLQVESRANAGEGIFAASNGAGECYVERNIIRNTAATPSSRGLTAQFAQTIYVGNNIVYDWNQGIGSGSGSEFTDEVYCHNNTVYDCTTGYYHAHTSGTLSDYYFDNCVAQNCTTDWGTGGVSWTSGSQYNCSEDGTHPGTNGQTGTVTFVDTATDDFHLSTADTVALDNGVDLSSDTDYPITVDNENASRTGTWDIGAHQEDAPAAGGRRIFVVS